MNLVISIADHEIEMAHRWFDFVCELCGTGGHSLYLIPAAGVNITDIMPKAIKAFGYVNIIKDDEGETSNWQITEPMRSASGPNSAFRQVAWYFYHNKLGPYFWCELDCIPLKRDWLDRLEAEYKACGKPFMGAHVEIESVPVHMSGNGIYVNVPQEAPTLIMRTNWTPRDQERSFELAFDIAGAAEVIPKAHWTKLIQHKFRYEGFKSRAEFDAIIDPNAVVFHSDKKGTIYQYLRENLSGKYKEIDGVFGKKLILNPDSVQDFPVTKGESSGAIAGVAPKSGATSPTVASRTFKPELESVIAQNAVIRNGLPAMSPPWENREDTERDVKMLCEALALFTKAPVYKARVRQALREAKIIK